MPARTSSDPPVTEVQPLVTGPPLVTDPHPAPMTALPDTWGGAIPDTGIVTGELAAIATAAVLLGAALVRATRRPAH